MSDINNGDRCGNYGLFKPAKPFSAVGAVCRHFDTGHKLYGNSDNNTKHRKYCNIDNGACRHIDIYEDGAFNLYGNLDAYDHKDRYADAIYYTYGNKDRCGHRDIHKHSCSHPDFDRDRDVHGNIHPHIAAKRNKDCHDDRDCKSAIRHKHKHTITAGHGDKYRYGNSHCRRLRRTDTEPDTPGKPCTHDMDTSFNGGELGIYRLRQSWP